MANDFLTTYKYGWKTSYYQNTNDLKSDDEPAHPIGWKDDVPEDGGARLGSLLNELSNVNEEECESCAI